MKGKDCQNRYSTFASNLCPSSQLASPIPTGTYPIIRPQGPGPQPLRTLLRLSSYIFQAKISYNYTSGAIHKRLKICSEYIVGGCGTPVSSRTFALLPKWRNPERSIRGASFRLKNIVTVGSPKHMIGIYSEVVYHFITVKGELY